MPTTPSPPKEPKWRPVLAGEPAGPLLANHRWLLSRRSTSLSIRAASGSPPVIHLIQQGWYRPLPSEARWLRLSPGRLALIRQVEIFCADQRWMLARSVIPKQTLRNLRDLDLLGTKPIGQVLFSQPSMQRSDFCFALLYGDRPPLSPQLHFDRSVWGRRSLFTLRGHSLLLSEAFLPEFQHWLERQP